MRTLFFTLCCLLSVQAEPVSVRMYRPIAGVDFTQDYFIGIPEIIPYLSSEMYFAGDCWMIPVEDTDGLTVAFPLTPPHMDARRQGVLLQLTHRAHHDTTVIDIYVNDILMSKDFVIAEDIPIHHSFDITPWTKPGEENRVTIKISEKADNNYAIYHWNIIAA